MHQLPLLRFPDVHYRLSLLIKRHISEVLDYPQTLFVSASEVTSKTRWLMAPALAHDCRAYAAAIDVLIPEKDLRIPFRSVKSSEFFGRIALHSSPGFTFAAHADQGPAPCK